MKKYYCNLVFLYSLFVHCSQLAAQESKTALLSRKWKMDIVYADSEVVKNKDLARLSYHFTPKGHFIMGDDSTKETMTFAWKWQRINDGDKDDKHHPNIDDYEFIIFRSDNSEVQTGKLLHLSLHHLIFTSTIKTNVTNKDLFLEYRMVPDK